MSTLNCISGVWEILTEQLQFFETFNKKKYWNYKTHEYKDIFIYLVCWTLVYVPDP